MELSTLKLTQAASLVYPIMLTQEAEEISEAKAAELLGFDIVSYREKKAEAIQAVIGMVEKLPSPLILLLDGMKAKR
jgi:hypothetical protein